MFIFKIIRVPTSGISRSFSQKAGNIAVKPVRNVLKTMTARVVPPVTPPALDIIKKYTVPIPWDEVSKEITEQKLSKDVHGAVLNSLLVLKDVDITMSYHKYITDKGGTFSDFHIFMLVKVLSRCCLTKVLKYEDFLRDLYDKYKENILSEGVFQAAALPLFSYVRYCYEDILKGIQNNPSAVMLECIICRAFDFDNASVAWELLEKSDYNMSGAIFDSFVNYCIKQAVRNNFSVDLIQRFVDISQSRTFYIHSSDILCSLQPLVNVLSHCQDDYIWSVKKSTVNPQMECLCCNTKLKELKISEEEFQKLKEAVDKSLMPKDVFIKTSHDELKKFNYFLRNCQPYDLVLDGLNVHYRSTGKGFFTHVFTQYVTGQNKRVLVIGRAHLKKDMIFKSLPNVQFFYTHNSSDDDIFLVYAAMNGGLGTEIVTGDFLNSHSAKLDSKMKRLFTKWQHYHQFNIDYQLGLVNPSRHLGLSQCTESPETGGKSYKWHLSYTEKLLQPYIFRTSFDWVCLQATPKHRKVPQSSSFVNDTNKLGQ